MHSFRLLLTGLGIVITSTAAAASVISSTDVIFNVDLTSAPEYPNIARAYFSVQMGAGSGQGLDVGETIEWVFYNGVNGSGAAFDAQSYALPFQANFASMFSDNPMATDGIYSVGLHVTSGSIDVTRAYGHGLVSNPCCTFTSYYDATLASATIPVPPSLALVGAALLALRLTRKTAPGRSQPTIAARPTTA